MNNSPHFQGIIFDLDGTLLNTLADLAAAGNRTLAAMGLPTHPVESYRHMVGNGISTLVERILPPLNRGKATEELGGHLFRKYYSAHMYDSTAPYPGIPNALSLYRQQGVRLAVLSNKADEYVKEMCEKYFPNCFDYCLGHSEAFPIKPAPDSCYSLLARLGLEKRQVLYCGDSDVDMQTAKNAGLAACGVLWGFRDENELLSAGADYVCSSVQELNSLVHNGFIQEN